MTNERRWSRADAIALVFAIAFPTVVTWVYFVALANRAPATQQLAYSIGKTIQFAFPAVWAWWTGRLCFRSSLLSTRGVMLGAAFGLVIAGAMIGLYFGWLKSSAFFVALANAIRAKAAGIGVQSVGAFLALGSFYSLCHSLMEEYYWRWFVFGLLRRDTLAANFGLVNSNGSTIRDEADRLRLPLGIALLISSLGFMAHHVLLLATYFGWESPATYIFSLAVAMGGVAWGWLYERTGSLYGGWISHLLVDAAIFVVGFSVIRS